MFPFDTGLSSFPFLPLKIHVAMRVMDEDENRIFIVRGRSICYRTFVDELPRRIVKHVNLNCRSALVSHGFEQREFRRSKTKNGHRNRGNADKSPSLVHTENGSKDFQVQFSFA